MKQNPRVNSRQSIDNIIENQPLSPFYFRHRNGDPNPTGDSGRASGGGGGANARGGGQYAGSGLEYANFYVPTSGTETAHARSWAGVPRGSCDLPVDAQHSAVRRGREK